MDAITATDAALAELARLSERHGPLMLVQSGGCCDGSSPLCLHEGELLVGPPNDRLLGHVGGVPFWIDADQYERWNRPAFVLDVAAGAAEGFSLEGPDGKHFLAPSPRDLEEEDMTVDTKGFREAHEAIQEETAELRLAARKLPTLSPSERKETRADILRNLREDVLPHMKLDEQLLYPAVARRLGDPLIASSMNYDHLAIRHWIDDLAATNADDTVHLQELLYGLDALIRVHLWKENMLFIGPLESPSWPG